MGLLNWKDWANPAHEVAAADGLVCSKRHCWVRIDLGHPGLCPHHLKIKRMIFVHGCSLLVTAIAMSLLWLAGGL